MISILSFLVCITGLVVFAISEKPKPQRIGEICFGVGLFFVLAYFGGQMIKVLP